MRSGGRLNQAPLVGLAEAGVELGLCLEDPLDHAEREIGVVLGDDREAGVVLELTRERAIIGLGPGLKETKQPLLLLTEPDGNGRQLLLLGRRCGHLLLLFVTADPRLTTMYTTALASVKETETCPETCPRRARTSPKPPYASQREKENPSVSRRLTEGRDSTARIVQGRRPPRPFPSPAGRGVLLPGGPGRPVALSRDPRLRS